jgi:predicted porin
MIMQHDVNLFFQGDQMKSALLAGMLVASLSMTTHAQNLSIYGLIDTAIQNNNQGTGSYTRAADGLWSQSFLGFRGSEDLGRGLRANFMLEAALLPSMGRAGHSTAVTNEIFSREAWVGLSGTLGEFRVGRSDLTIAHDLDVRTSQFGNLGMHGANKSAIAGGSDLSNAVRYISPEIKGFTLYLGHATGNGNGATTEANAAHNSMAIDYNQGKLRINVGAWKQDATTLVARKDMMGAGASYDFGAFSVGLSHDRGDNSTTADITSKITTASLAVPLLDDVSLHAVYSQSTNGEESSSNQGQGWTVGISKNLSKRTRLYAAYTSTDNEANSYMSMQGQTTPTTGGLDLKTLSAGIRHTF